MIDPDQAADTFARWLEPLLETSGAYAYAIVGNRTDAEDAVQEAALKAYRKFAAFDSSRSFRGWWLAVLRNCCRDLLRRRRRFGARSLEDEPAAATPIQPSDVQSDLGRALRALSVDHREILQLRYYADCSYRDIAAALAIPEGTVMSRLHAARQALAASYKRIAE